MGTLAALGLSALEEQVYEHVASRPSATVGELTTLAASAAERKAAVARLAQLALLHVDGDRLTVTPPEPAIGALVHARQQELDLARTHSQQLALRARTWESRRAEGLVEVLVGRDAIQVHYEQMQRIAQDQLLLLDRPPYPVTGGTTIGANPIEVERMAAGVVYRTLFDRSLLDDPLTLARVRSELESGERGRVLRGVPLKLAIADRALALLPLLDADGSGEPAALLIRSSVLLDSLVALFEALWQRGVPLQVATAGPELEDVDPDLRNVVAMMAAGLTDDSIARQLGASERTVRRRIAGALDALGAETRFQAGLRAAQLGWLPDL